jgi:hypothetical protein
MKIVLYKIPYFNSNKIDLCILIFGRKQGDYRKLLKKIKLITYKNNC